MKFNFSKGLAVMLLPGLLSCSIVSSVSTAPLKTQENDNPEQIEIVRLKNSGLISENASTAYIADVGNGKKGADIAIEIRLSKEDPGFKTAANNTNGTLAKTAGNIQTYQIYLVKNSAATAYPPGGDPIGADLVSGPFTLTNSGASAIVMLFTNVASAGSSAYYAAVRAKDSGGIDLIRVNNGSGTAWTGTTASSNGQVAVSSGAGVIVNASLAVSSTSALLVTPNLLDAVGATLQAVVAPSPGSNVTPAINGF